MLDTRLARAFGVGRAERARAHAELEELFATLRHARDTWLEEAGGTTPSGKRHSSAA